MADITSRYQGNVSDEGQQNWRGDQVSAPQGGQSIYETSSVPLADLGSRKVVGDRVFRYAKMGTAPVTVVAGDLVGATAEVANMVNIVASTSFVPGSKQVRVYCATGVARDYFADGYLWVQSGTHQGVTYRVKSHNAVSTTQFSDFVLYDAIATTCSGANKFSLRVNPYKDVSQCTTTISIPVGVAPIGATTGDYFWLQTWGPTAVKNSVTATVIGQKMAVGLTGGVQIAAATTGLQVGYSMQVATGAEKCLAFIQIAP